MLYNMFGLFILLCLHIQEVQLQVNLTLTTSTPIFGSAVELRCTYTGASPCCDSNRIWNKAGVAIMTNGSTKSASKYKEEINTCAKYFILKIEYLELSDLGQAYTCQYGFFTSATLTLTQDSTYIYPPTESCPMTNDKRRIFGTLNITKSQPSPTFVAYYKGKNWTSLLTETSPVLYDTYYYTKSATLNLPGGLTCGNDEIFILTVVTGTVETTICSVDYCKCGECAGKCYGWSTLGTVIAVIFILGGFCFKVPRLAELTTIQKILPGVGLFICSAVLNLFAIIIWKDCSCIGKSICSKVMLLVGTMDLPARAGVLNMTQYNGEYSCIFCLHPGVVVKSGHCRSFPYSIHQMRTTEETKRNAIDAHNSRKRVKGMLGISVLNYLPYYLLCEYIVVDYMHGVLLGICKKLLGMWFNATSADKPYFIGNKITEVDKLLKHIKPPYLINRLPRKLSNTLHHWKASELRSWLLFYSIPCLRYILPDLYLKHYSLMVEGTYLLLSEGISTQDIKRADLLLTTFVKSAESLYGKEFMGLQSQQSPPLNCHDCSVCYSFMIKKYKFPSTDNTDPWFILLGLGTCLITTAVFIVVTDPNNKDAACKLFSVGLVCLVILHEKIKGKDEENPPHAKDEDHSGQKEHGKNASSEGKKDKQ